MDEKLAVVRELHRPARKNFPRRHVIIRGLNETFQSDLADFQKFSKQNRGHRFILVVIDIFSKYLWTIPLKNKTGMHVAEAMESIFKQVAPKNLQVDQGREFWNKDFQQLCKKYHVNLYSTFSVVKCAIAERVIRTLKAKLYFEFSARGKYRWIDILQDVTKQYNETVHHTTKFKPIDVTPEVEKKILSEAYSHIKIFKPADLNIGDIVRISKYKGIFDKSFNTNWTNELFKIRKRQMTNPVTYLLSDFLDEPIAGAFYRQELQKTAHPDVFLIEKVLRRGKGNQIYVKYLGIKKPEWIKNTDIL